MRRLLVLVLLFACAPVLAGELGISWNWVDHPPPPYSYIVLRDGQPWTGTSNLMDPDPNDPTRVRLLVIGLPPGGDDNCGLAMWQVQAVNMAGPSGPSLAVSSLPRPAGPGGSGSINVVLDSGGVHQIIGDYFSANAVVTVDGVMVPPQDVNHHSCQLLDIPTTTGTPYAVCVTNPALPESPSCWDQPPPPPPTGVEPF